MANTAVPGADLAARPQEAVFSGAGLSGALPAGLPTGFALRDALLEVVYEVAASELGDAVSRTDVDDVISSNRKLEVVLGRLVGAVGDGVLGCLDCLQVEVPNEAHMLAALHLARGGTHATVNVDLGIELAYELLSGARELPDTAPAALRSQLPRWREAAGSAGQLRVVASREQFERWVADGSPPGLLKVHGSLDGEGRAVHDVVIQDFDELGQLSPGRRAAVDGLGHLDGLVVTGYSGADPDVYGPLLKAAARTRALWSCPRLPDGSPVPDDCAVHSIELVLHEERGKATHVLRDLLGVRDLIWPEVEVEQVGWQARFGQWASSLRRDDGDVGWRMGIAWGWLLADGGRSEEAERTLRAARERRPSAFATVRLADMLYDRGRDRDRVEAAWHYLRLSAGRATDPVSRSHALLRLGGVVRGRGLASGGALGACLALSALAMPMLVLLLQRRRPSRDRETTAAALSEIGHTGARALELFTLTLPRPAWPAVARALRHAADCSRRAAALSENGNRRALSTFHALLAVALADLLSGEATAREVVDELEALVESYMHAEDYPGAANCEAALSVAAMSRGDRGRALAHRRAAEELYGRGRPGGRPIRAGAALLDRLERLDGLMGWAACSVGMRDAGLAAAGSPMGLGLRRAVAVARRWR